MIPSTRYSLTTVAVSGDQFSGFGPYVPAVGDDGSVAFQASLRCGGSGVYRESGAGIEVVFEWVGMREGAVSHPDINRHGACCFYARDRSGQEGAYVASAGRATLIAHRAGPLGPTMNEAGAVAFRGPCGSGGGGVFRWERGTITSIAEAGPVYSGFHGLPVIDARGRVVFRADVVSGEQVIGAANGESAQTLVATGERFATLGSFPSVDDAGTVVFAAGLRAGGSGVFAARDGAIETLLDDGALFESFRGVLVDGAGRAVFCATPRGGALGVFSGPDPRADRLLSLGEPLLGSVIAEFALNPVSMNGAGRFAVRVRLDDGRELILRADPDGA